MTRFIHGPSEYRIDQRRVDTVYALIDAITMFGPLLAGDEVRLKTSDGTPVVLRLSDIDIECIAQIVYEEMCRRRQQTLDAELYRRADAAIADKP